MLISNTGKSLLAFLFVFLCCFSKTVTAEQNYPGPILPPNLKKGSLLVASKHLVDPYFEHSVILLTQYDSRGGSGIILNHRSPVPLDSSFPNLGELLPMLDYLYIGGPVAESRVSLLVQSSYLINGANEVLQDIYHIDTQILFHQLDLEKLVAKTTRVFSGYAGWAPGQLEAEIRRGDWHLWHADVDIIFSLNPEELWGELIDLASAKWVSR